MPSSAVTVQVISDDRHISKVNILLPWLFTLFKNGTVVPSYLSLGKLNTLSNSMNQALELCKKDWRKKETKDA